ncbi:zinc dependent phospholipase C family protein [Ekhidna sp.]|uniref:zinc dependent phospholipase C family protein n=1 Tax=Ekhidna sp. TaxID=2608089 RepID=UPI003BAADFC5
MRILLLSALIIMPILSQSWGFFAHQKINRLAVFTLPPELIGFYKENIQYITEKAVNPDMRRYAVKEEAARHYIDVDVYGDSAVYKMPRYWSEAVEKYSEDTLQAYGIVPYHINRMSFWLIKAFQNKDAAQILRLSSDVGHYIADANVPLHTTENYNGQLTNQYGIHGFWESRLPELFFENYDLLSGKAEYVENLQLYAWDAVVKAHEALDSVFMFEKQLTRRYPESKKYGYEERGNATIRTYTFDFSSDYHRRLNGMVERRMRASIKMVGDFWFTCWVKAGQPDLGQIMNGIELQDSVFVVRPEVKLRNHEAGIDN